MAQVGTGSSSSLSIHTLSNAARTALITGASRGIGAATAIALARAGITQFFLHYNSFAEGIQRLQNDLQHAGAAVAVCQADLTQQSGIDTLISSYQKWFQNGRDEDPTFSVDVLVNNAGSLLGRAKLVEFTPDLYDAVMNLNVKSVWFLSQAVSKGMIENGRGCIVNLSSIAARNGGGTGATVYAAAKGAIATITKGMAKELAPQGIRVNAVSPGTVDNHFHEKYSNKQILDSVVAQTPAGRLGDNDEVADTILFLCSDAARYIYGQTIEINGGMYMV